MLFEALHQLNPVTHINSAIQHVGGWGKGKKTVSQEQYLELVHYFKYASTAYSLINYPSPNGATVLCKLFDLLTDTNGYICRDDKRKEIVLVMRGTMSITNLIVDFSAKMVPIKVPNAPEPVRVHQGFQTAWSSVTAYALTIIREQLNVYPDYNIITVGHSLGGAMASLAAVTLKEVHKDKPVRMYTYGQPRTGNIEYARYANTSIGVDKIFRVVHGLDGVPTMVPMTLGYHHHGTEYWSLDPAGPNRTFICDGAGVDKEDPEGSQRVLSTGINLAHCEYFGIPWLVPFFKLGV